MRKRFTIGVLCLGLMVFWANGAAAIVSSTFLGGGYKLKCLLFTSDWLVKNTDVRPATYSVVVNPFGNVLIHFANPGENTGGNASANFGSDVYVTLSSTVTPPLSGKGPTELQMTFGDCDVCTDSTGNYNGQGALWLMLAGSSYDIYNSAVTCDAKSTDLEKIDCVKSYLTFTYEPNTKWRPVSLTLLGFNSVLRAWQDVDKNCTQEEIVYAEYHNCVLDTATGNYNCSQPAPYPLWQLKNGTPNPDPTPSVITCP